MIASEIGPRIVAFPQQPPRRRAVRRRRKSSTLVLKFSVPKSTKDIMLDDYRELIQRRPFQADMQHDVIHHILEDLDGRRPKQRGRRTDDEIRESVDTMVADFGVVIQCGYGRVVDEINVALLRDARAEDGEGNP